MNCNYIIQLPNGGSLKIPANFGTIESTPEITSKLESLDKEADNFLEVVSDVVNDLYKLSGQTILDKETIHNIVTSNVDNVSEIIPIINNIIENNSEFNNLSRALKVYLINESKENIAALEDNLNTPVTRDYFNRQSLSGVFNTTNIESEHLKLRSILGESTSSGFESAYLFSFNDFLQSIKRYNSDLYKQYNLFSTNNQLGLKSINVNTLNFFKEGDLDTLFLTLIKRLGDSLDIDSLNAALETNYKKPSDFFNQKLSKTKDIKNSHFENLLLSKDTKDKIKLNNLIKLFADTLQDKSLNKSLKTLFINLNKELFSEEYQSKISLEEALSLQNASFSKEYRNLKYSKILNSTTENFGENYSEYYQLKSQDLYRDAIETITPGQDFVKLSDNGKPILALVTDIFIREKQGQITGLNIRGLYENSEGKIVEISQDFLNGQTIEYKLKETPKLEYTQDFLKNEQTAIINGKLPQQSAKFILSGGDIVNNKYIVVGIYPEYVIGKDNNNIVHIPYSSINQVRSSLLHQLNNKWSSGLLDLQVTRDPNEVSIGDFVSLVDGQRLLVVGMDGNDLYYLDDKAKLTKGSREYVDHARINNIETFTKADENKLIHNLNIDNIDSTMSTFTSFNKVMINDLGVGELNGEEVYFKVLNNKTKRIVTNEGYYTTFDKLTNVRFFTDRDISSKTSLENIKNNSIIITVKDSNKIEGDLFVPLKYIVPKGTNLNSLFLLPNNYANIGFYQEANKELKSTEVDATKKILTLLKKSGSVGDTIYGEKEYSGTNKLKKNINNYVKVQRFSDLSQDSKEALNILRSGTYFSVYTKSSTDPKIYRIIESTEDSIIAQYNIINSKGNIITIEKEFKAEDLLATKQPYEELRPEGSIANLYLYYKNKNLKSVINAVNENQSPEVIKSQHYINELSNKIEVTFSKLGIQVIHTSDSFEDSQHAKVTSDETGKVSILLNTKSGKFSDLVHETLHIYLTLLRYTDKNAYGELINAVVKEEANVYNKEEEFVKKVVEFSKGYTDFLYNDLKTFMGILSETVQNLVKESTGEDLNLNFSELVNNPLEFLNTSLGEFYGINPTQNDHSFYNVGLLSLEPMYRNWLKDNNIILKCD